ncbi:bifunctional histidinol-phosphatase/imidazoleglycerol-phosphate dehydratase HisB [Flavobacteriaceae bacterium 14752]|uniref:bifunctional histidinol-phosphatase/imidazoleglycerol-phosphate dehydratase HisB n=1 Tax=Mesohalobacter salilacus TaxID=2491711 RepID=UPI000F6355E9|nr:bifunctional histidinol-phosphatase/imidazoleglycerol-phosphate dehydratase HisB [Flavobacteriaceae bacterium 14752]
MKKLLLIDRDGTIIKEPEDEQIDSFEKLEFYPEAISFLSKIGKLKEFELIMITNQDGLGTKAYPENTFWPVQNFIVQTLENEGIVFKDILIDKTFPHQNADTRKPKTGLLKPFMNGDYDLKNSIVIGDRLTDIELAKNIGGKGIYINNNRGLGDDELSNSKNDLQQHIILETQTWSDIYNILRLGTRTVKHSRHTKETQIDIEINLDGTGQFQATTGLAFFDHMLEQIARHALIDLNMQVQGDLQVDEHHTIEDTAIALGEAFQQAIGNKLGMERYGFYLPMDDALAHVTIDFGGRPWLVWKADFKREYIGDMPTEMFMHFFKSFTDAAKANLNIKAEGQNEHHKIESIFKAFARAIKAAIRRDTEKVVLPSTKGQL